MKEHISTIQLAALLYNAIVPTAILVVPNVVITHSHQDAWASILGATAIGVGLAFFLGMIVKANPGTSFPAWMKKRFGRFAGIAVGLLLTQYYISISSVILEEFTNILTDQILIESPSYVLMAVIMAIACYAVYMGIEVIARVNGVVTTITVVAYCISFFMFVNLIDLRQLQPVLNHSLSKISYGGLLPFGWISEIAILLILAPYLKNSATAGKAAVWGTVFAGFHLAITVTLCITVFGPHLPVQFRYPSFTMIEVIKLGTTLERLDILFVSFWLCTIYIKMFLFLFGAYHCLTETLGLKRSRPLLLALGLTIVMTAAVSLQDEGEFDMLSQHVTPYELFNLNVILPLIIGLGLLVTRKQSLKRGS
jgi:spore germination protein KB